MIAPAEELLLNLFCEIWVERCYAPEDSVIVPEHTIVDVGAHVGVFALWAATTNPQAKIISLEPSPRMCTFLHRNISANGLKNITVVPSACAGRRGNATLYRRGRELGNTLYTGDKRGSRFCPLVQTEILTLGDVLERFGISVCGLLKLDCEGAEYEILLGAETGVLERVERIAMEYHVGLNEYTPETLIGFLESRGFDIRLLPTHEGGGYIHATRRK